MDDVTAAKLRHNMLIELQRLDASRSRIYIVGVCQAAISALGLKPGQYVEPRDALTIWYDLFRCGVIAPGEDFNNNELLMFHVTQRGRKALSGLSRDPHNPEAYMAAIAPYVAGNEVAESYVSEGLATFNSGHHRAAAALIGIATEALILALRDTLIVKMGAVGRAPSKDMAGWTVKLVSDAVEKELQAHKKGMGKPLDDRFDSVWRYIAPVRLLRNAAGHPNELRDVVPDAVHGNYIYFHDIAKLLHDLKQWAETKYQPTVQ